MPVKLNQFATGPITADSSLIGYQTAQPGGERKWTASALKDWLANEMKSYFVPVGSVVAFPATQAPAGWLKLNGAVLQRAQYPALWSYIQQSGNLVSEAQWYSASNTVNRWGSFSIGDGINTFRLPEVRGEFLRAWDDGRHNATEFSEKGRILGSFQGDAIRNITATIAGINGAGSQAYTWGFQPGRRGAVDVPLSFAPYNKYNGVYYPPGGVGVNANFNAAYVVPTTADDNRPRNLAFLYCIKA